MSKTKYTFKYEFESDLSGGDCEVELINNASDLSEIIDHFKSFLLASGWEYESVRQELISYEDYRKIKKLYDDERWIKTNYKDILDRQAVELLELKSELAGFRDEVNEKELKIED